MSGTQALLSEYTQGGSEQAFRELVGCYVNFVFSTAIRIVGGDRALAEDVTQTVFTDLARKAALLPKDVRLGGWLHRHTCFVARKALRRERRRIAREKQAIELHSVEDYSEANLAQLALVLDEVINDLGEPDRSAIVLRFFEELDFRSIGEALGSTEDAARMRVSRAVEKIGALLKRRGIVLTAAGISFVLSGKLATAAPVGLATRIIYVELARPVKVHGIFGILREACFTKLNVGIVSAAVILALVVLLFSSRRSGAKVLPDPNGKTVTPAEVAGLAVDEPDEPVAPQTEVALRSGEVSPAASRPTSAVGMVPVQTAGPDKAVPVNVRPALVPTATATPPAPAAMSPVDNAGGGDLTGDGRVLPRGIPGGQRPWRNMPPRVSPVPQPPSPTVISNSPDNEVVRNSSSLNADSDGGVGAEQVRMGDPQQVRVGDSQQMRMGQPEQTRMGPAQQMRAGPAQQVRAGSGDSRKRGGQQ